MNNKKIISIILAVMLMLSLIPNAPASAKTKLNITDKTLMVGNTATIKISGTKKKVQWSVSNSHIRIIKKTKKYAKIKAVSSGISYLYAKSGKKTYSCTVFVKEKSNVPETMPKPTQTPNPEEKTDYISDFTIPEQEVYNGNGVSISIGNVEKTTTGVNIEFICLSNSDKNYSISAHEYAVNNLMAGGNLYGSDVDLSAGKKAKFSISIDAEWFKTNNIKDFKKLDVMFWAYYDDIMEWETEKISISTNNDNGGNYYNPTGNKIYSDSNMELYYLSNDKKSYKFCLKNNTQNEKRWIVDNCSINDWSYDLGSCKYDLYSEPIFDDCYSVFELVVDDDFLQSNSISTIKSIEFDIEFEYDIKSDIIKLEL